ncbi:glycine zipper 2TM domain-containing protein [Sphingomonas sp. NFR15]|uniref:glycine zipper 2TM domain-containing protein n=1 Tax=Sphingomonas sp. NFR15 TaxID=1566282 RepID=UPI0008810CED|nr:glycine zipper 2TM domain-containing protein [Sphingomonas sp. NFR15]SDA21929.1 Glycine zipper 2TM domain-containing protein [Sphingomonas sp. NFR15]
MRKLIIAAVAALTLVPAIPATAQDRQWDHGHQRQDDRRGHDDRGRGDWHGDRDRGPGRGDRAGWRGDNRDWRRFRGYDYNRPEPGQRFYYADRYYRDGSYYQPRRLGRYDRIYRGSNGRYYCRRSDGTTGLIVGGIAGGLLGNALSNGRSSTLGTLLGVAGGAALGTSIDRGQVVCR